jgi:hypothetical protein
LGTGWGPSNLAFLSLAPHFPVEKELEDDSIREDVCEFILLASRVKYKGFFT